MHYTEDFSIHHFAGFSQIGSHMISSYNQFYNNRLIDVHSDKCVDECLHVYIYIWYKCHKTIIVKCSEDTQAI